MKKARIILYLIGIILILLGIGFVLLAAFGGMEGMRIPGYIFIAISWPELIVAFALDFRETMMISETSGDRYTIMSRLSLYEEAVRRGLEPDDNKTREYYVTLLRDEDQKIKEEGH